MQPTFYIFHPKFCILRPPFCIFHFSFFVLYFHNSISFLQSTFHIPHCTVCVLHSTFSILQPVHCLLHSLFFILHSASCRPPLYFIFHSEFGTLPSPLYILHFLFSIISSIFPYCDLHSTSFISQSSFQILYFTFCIFLSTIYIPYSALYGLHSSFYILYFTFSIFRPVYCRLRSLFLHYIILSAFFIFILNSPFCNPYSTFLILQSSCNSHYFITSFSILPK